MVGTSRRRLLVGMVGVVAAACVRPAARAPATASTQQPPELTAWEREAKAILSDALETLRTFEVFTAFRVAAAGQSDRRAANELAWDPPGFRAWDEATHVARGLHGRSEQLLQSIATRQLDASQWREQRDWAQWAHDLLDVGDALDAFRMRVAYLPTGSDGTAAWEVLDRAWARFDAAAANWGVSRAERIGCGATS
ncbi:MAG TPA: hypothetical protein VFB50_12700 [Chloroflexota bacterium]|nr:hypothetical protein [Chloroflexota bacterium]